MFDAGKNHARHPEKDDVVARYQHVRRVEIFIIVRFIGEAERRERPQRRRKPGIQHVLVLYDVFAAAIGAARGVLFHADGFTAVFAIPHGDAVPPPQLTGNAPIAYVFHPVVVNFRKPFGNETHAVFHYRRNRGFCQRLHFHEPLFRNNRLHDIVAAVAVPHVMHVRLNGNKIAARFQIFHHALSRFVSVQPVIFFAGVFVHRSVVVHHADDFQIVALAHLEVVRIVRGRNLHAARAEFYIHVLVRHHGDFPVCKRQFQSFPHQRGITLVRGVHRHGGIAEHRFGTRRSHNHVLSAVRRRIADLPERTGFFRIFHFRVRKRGFAAGAPVDDAVPLINQPFFIQIHENFAHRFRTFFVHRERLTRPVARSAHFALLLHDAVAVFFFPRPGAL